MINFISSSIVVTTFCSKKITTTSRGVIPSLDATNPNSDRVHFVCSAADLQKWSAQPISLSFRIIILGIIDKTQSDFLYPDFESKIGIDFNGAAATSSCDEGKRLRYQPRHGTADQNIRVPPSLPRRY